MLCTGFHLKTVSWNSFYDEDDEDDDQSASSLELSETADRESQHIKEFFIYPCEESLTAFI